jgi:hypothetical protein
VLGTYCLAAAYNLSKTQVYNKNSFVNMEGLASESTYQSFWNLISVYGCRQQENHVSIRGFRPHWMDVQTAFNETCRELFVEAFNSYMRIIVDDDKMHYQAEKYDTQGLKIMQHLRDNRKGFVAHTACYTPLAYLLGLNGNALGMTPQQQPPKDSSEPNFLQLMANMALLFYQTLNLPWIQGTACHPYFLIFLFPLIVII